MDEGKYAVMDAIEQVLRPQDAVALVCQEDGVSGDADWNLYLDFVQWLIVLTANRKNTLFLLPNVPWVGDRDVSQDLDAPVTYSSNPALHRRAEGKFSSLARSHLHVYHVNDTLTAGLLCDPDEPSRCSKYIPGTQIPAYADVTHLTFSGAKYLASFWSCYFQEIGFA